MKVIGKGGNEVYICEVSHTEIEKFLNLYYGRLDNLRVGEEINLGKGHDFFEETSHALKETRNFIGANKRVIESILNGVDVLCNFKEKDNER